MVGVSANFYGLTIQVTTNTSEICVKFVLVWAMYKWAAMFCTKDDMDTVFYQGLCHDV